MTIYCLIQGELHRDPVQRASASGKTFVTCNIKSIRDGDTTWCSVITFSEDAMAELLRLKAGDAVSVQGKLKVGICQKDGSDPRPSLDVVASAVVGLKPKPRTRQPRQARTDGREFDPRQAYARPDAGIDPDFDDPIPFS
jgi:single-stranded DNA-binding protein